MNPKIILAGGSGFLGRSLLKWFKPKGYDVVILSRRRVAIDQARVIYWDGRTLGAWSAELEGAEALINLAGRSVNCRYNRRNCQQIMDSRIESTRILGEAIQQCSEPPRIWMNSSTATIYKHTFGMAHDESGTIGSTPQAKDEFSIQVATSWEAEFNKFDLPATRQIILRMAMIFGDEPGGVFDVLQRLAQWGLGGRMGSGRQYMSWIHTIDFCRCIEWLINRSHAEGVYNVSAPQPVSNSEMMKIIREGVGRAWGLPASEWMLEAGTFIMRTETELVIKSRRVIPKRLLDEGFTFKYPTPQDAVQQLTK